MPKIKMNEGPFDRAIRFFLALIFIFLGLISRSEVLQVLLIVTGIGVLLTAAIGYDSFYRVFNFSTLPKKLTKKKPHGRSKSSRLR